MRPEILNPLFASFKALEKVGDKTARLLNGMFGDDKIVNLLWHLPNGFILRRPAATIAEATDFAIIEVRTIAHEKPPRKSVPYRVRCCDRAGDEIVLSFFHGQGDYLGAVLPIGETRFISGRIETFNRKKQISHPDYIAKNKVEIPEFEPVYPLTAGITRKMLHRFCNQALGLLPDMPEWLDNDLLKREKWRAFGETLTKAHRPAATADLDHAARRRLAYDELLANQLALALVRKEGRAALGTAMPTAAEPAAKVKAALPFSLTGAQERAIAEISLDMAGSSRMMRLLQGDVGSGKTVVAFFAALNAIANGHQAAIMAPTDILARQHYASLKELAGHAGVKVLLVTGAAGKKEREEALKQASSGTAALIIGTHALFQDWLEFKSLKLVVIDEQHRFGVHQRLKLKQKGRRPDMLVMSATPIPRTLALTVYGDMEISVLDEKPAGRKAIITVAMNIRKIDEVAGAIGRAIKSGQQIYWVCPLVEETEKSDLKAATLRAAFLEKLFPGQVGLIHGRMKAEEKDDVLNRFAAGKIAILTATTVIEVGIDVKKATVMVIEHSERFGLSQLHQLRGRVGRSDQQSTCILLYADPLGDTAKARINALRATVDGFKIAEEDLKIRGMGDVLGTRQSGMADFRLADLNLDRDLLLIAARDARMIVAADPQLSSGRGQALRLLLYLFAQDDAVKNLSGG